MGQKQCRAQSFISLMQNFLVKSGAKVTRQQLRSYLELIGEYNRWSPDEWTLETGLKNFTQKNAEKAGRIEDNQVSFWIISALIRAVIIILEGECARNSFKRRYPQNVAKKEVFHNMDKEERERGLLRGSPNRKGYCNISKKEAPHSTDEEDGKEQPVRDFPNGRRHRNVARKEMAYTTDEEDEKECVRDPPVRICHCNAAKRERPYAADVEIRKRKLRRDSPNERCYHNVTENEMRTKKKKKICSVKPQDFSSEVNKDRIMEELNTSPCHLTLKSDQRRFQMSDVPRRPHEFRLLFPIILSQENHQPTYESLDVNAITAFKKACVSYGPTSSYVWEYLNGWSQGANWIPYDFEVIAKIGLSPSQYLQWKMWRSDMAKEKLRSLGASGRQLPGGGQLTYDMLVGDGQWVTTEQQILLPQAAFIHIRDVALWAWEKIEAGSEFAGSYTKVFQGARESYADFVRRLTDSIEKQVRGEGTRKLLLKQLAFENANEDCQTVIRPIKEKEDIFGYLKACRNIGTFKHRARLAALETFAIQKQMNAKCFNCGKRGHLRKNCWMLHTTQRYHADTSNSHSPGICPKCQRGRHWKKECKSKFDHGGRRLWQEDSWRSHSQVPNIQRFTKQEHPIQFVPAEKLQT